MPNKMIMTSYSTTMCLLWHPGVDIQSNNNLYPITMVYSIRTQDHNGMKMCNRNIANCSRRIWWGSKACPVLASASTIVLLVARSNRASWPGPPPPCDSTCCSAQMFPLASHCSGPFLVWCSWCPATGQTAKNNIFRADILWATRRRPWATDRSGAGGRCTGPVRWVPGRTTWCSAAARCPATRRHRSAAGTRTSRDWRVMANGYRRPVDCPQPHKSQDSGDTTNWGRPRRSS